MKYTFFSNYIYKNYKSLARATSGGQLYNIIKGMKYTYFDLCI